MKYSTQHKYQCSEAYEKWALKNIKNVIHKPTARQAYMAACRTCIEGCNPGNGSEWISVDDRLPADTGIPYKRYFVRHINRLDPDLFWTGVQYWVDGKWDIENVTHWMPLPEPPIEPTTGTKTPEE